MTTRAEVYEAIDTEREYQDNLPPTRTEPYDNGMSHTVGDYIVMLHHYMNDLDKAWTLNPGDEAALEVMRKVAGIAVHCMENHGAPKRS